MTKIYFLVTDMDGNPIQNAKISGQSNCSPFGGGISTATTGRDGKAVIDTGCSGGGHGTYTVSALGYEDQIIDVNFPICYPFTNCDVHKVVTLAKVYTTNQGTVTTQSGVNVQGSKTESFIEKIKDLFIKDPLLVIIIILVIAFIIFLIAKPKLAKNLIVTTAKTTKKAVRKGAKATKNIIENLNK